MATAGPASAVKIVAPSGRVPYVVTSPMEFAFWSWRRGTRFGRLASFAGVHRSDRHSITHEITKIIQSLGRNGIEAYTDPPAISEATIHRVRSTRSPNTPANRPDTTGGTK